MYNVVVVIVVVVVVVVIVEINFKSIHITIRLNNSTSHTHGHVCNTLFIEFNNSPPPMCAGTGEGWRCVSPLVVQLSVGRRRGASPVVLPAGAAAVWRCPLGRGGGSGGRGG